MFRVLALVAALSACAHHPRRTMVGGAGLIVLGALAESTNHTTYCSGDGFDCVGTGIGDGITNGLAHATGEILVVGGLAAVIGGLVGLSNEDGHEAHKM